MKLHADAAFSLKQRAVLVSRVVDEKWPPAAAAAAAAVSERRAGAWVRRFKAERELGLLDRSPAPKNVDKRTPADRVEAIAALRSPADDGRRAACDARDDRLPLYCGEFSSPSDGKSPQ